MSSPTDEAVAIRALWPKFEQWARVWQDRLEPDDAVQVLALSALLTLRAGETSAGIIKHRCKTALVDELRHQFGDMRFPDSPRVFALRHMVHLDAPRRVEGPLVHDEPDPDDRIADADDRLWAGSLMERARQLFTQIEDPYAAFVARRRYLAGRTNAQVADELGVSSSYVAQLSEPARALLATLNPWE